ncbi:MAG: DNA repair protein RecO [Holophagaceae bacterium]|nr:DNA repair protein RecO [Holophagaceae bacterium]
MEWSHSAIVLKPTPFQEGGLVVSFLNEHGERIAGLARGAKKPTAKWVSAFEPLSFVKVRFFGREHSDIRRVTRCDLQFSPMTLGHLESSLVIACLADVVDKIAREGIEDPRLFRLMCVCSGAIKQYPDKALSILAYCEHWLLHCIGVLPNSGVCGNCGRSDTPFALMGDLGWYCSACTPSDHSESLPEGAKGHLQQLRNSKAEDAPEPNSSPASIAITHLLRARLLEEIGHIRSYEVLFKLVVEQQ